MAYGHTQYLANADVATSARNTAPRHDRHSPTMPFGGMAVQQVSANHAVCGVPVSVWRRTRHPRYPLPHVRGVLAPQRACRIAPTLLPREKLRHACVPHRSTIVRLRSGAAASRAGPFRGGAFRCGGDAARVGTFAFSHPLRSSLRAAPCGHFASLVRSIAPQSARLPAVRRRRICGGGIARPANWSALSFGVAGLRGSPWPRSRIRRKARHPCAGYGAERSVGIPSVASASVPSQSAASRRLRSLRPARRPRHPLRTL